MDTVGISRGLVESPDQLQKLEVSIVQGSRESRLKEPDSLRVLNSRAYLSHHRHVQNGRRREEKCSFCSEGVDGVVTDFTEEVAAAQLAEDNRSDEERTAARASGDGSDSKLIDELYG